jgi:hypothetical protein
VHQKKTPPGCAGIDTKKPVGRAGTGAARLPECGQRDAFDDVKSELPAPVSEAVSCGPARCFMNLLS